MRAFNLRRRLAVAGTIGATSLIAILGVGVSSAGAVPADPAAGYPSFNTGVVNQVRISGSETTFFMMQRIADLYTSAGLYGCTLNTGVGNTLYNSSFTSSATNANAYCQAGQNISTTDTADNWNRTEVYNGVDNVGSTAGQEQACGNSVLPSPYPVNIARSSKPANTSYCAGLVGAGYAKDAVDPVDFQLNPSALAGAATSSTYSSVNGGLLGPVNLGWEPGDPVNGTANSGTAFQNVSNNDNGGGATSTAYRLWCASGQTHGQITDWGQLTNLGPNIAVPSVQLNGSSNTATTSYPIATGLTFPLSITDLTTPGNLPGSTTVTGATPIVNGSGVTIGDTLTLNNPANTTAKDNLRITNGSTTLPVGSGGYIGLAVNIVGVNPNSGTESTLGQLRQQRHR